MIYCMRCNKNEDPNGKYTRALSKLCYDCEKATTNIAKRVNRVDGKNLVCTRCLKSKPPESFGVSKKNRLGRVPRCKECAALLITKRSKPIKAAYVSKATKYNKYVTPENKNKGYSRELLRRFYNYPNTNCRRGNKEFSLTLDEYAALSMGLCVYCNQKTPGKDYVGIDRVDSNIGYIKGNCVSCCKICNMMKNSHNKEYFLSHLVKIYNHLKLKG